MPTLDASAAINRLDTFIEAVAAVLTGNARKEWNERSAGLMSLSAAVMLARQFVVLRTHI